MNRTTARLATVGGIILLGAGAIALAQHDSRHRHRPSIRPAPQASQRATPIQVAGDWTIPQNYPADLRSPPKASESALAVRSDPEAVAAAFPSEAQGSENAAPSTTGNSGYDNLNSSPGRPVNLPPGPQSSAEIPPDPFSATTAQTLPSGETLTAAYADYDSEESIGQAEMASATGSISDNSSPEGLSTLPTAPSTSGTPPAANENEPSNGLNAGEFPMPLPPARDLRGSTASDNHAPDSSAESGNQRPSGSLPNGSVAATANGNAALPALPPVSTPITTRQPTIRQSPGTSDASGLSDTQRGAMRATELAPQTPSAPVTDMQSGPVSAPGAGSHPATTQHAFPGSMGAGPVGSSGSTSMPKPGVTDERVRTNRTAGSLTSAPIETQPSDLGASKKLLSNRPGERHLHGTQNPIMLIERQGPEEIQVGKPATFVFTVRNAGNATAHQVVVTDQVPRGARFEKSAPSVTPSADGVVMWNLGTIAAGDERTITLQLVPETQGEMGSTAIVQFAARAALSTRAVMPQLELELDSQPNVLIQDVQHIDVLIKNSGTGIAKEVRLEADIPAQLQHISGNAQLEAILGDLRPGENKRIALTASAIQPGQAECVVRAVTEDGVQAEKTTRIDVRAPQLVASIDGPKLRYLERQATYRVAVKNTGTAMATDLDFVVHLPTGFKFNSANNNGSYDPASHTVTWGLYELPPDQVAPMELTILPVELGAQMLSFSASGNLGISAGAESQVMVDGLAQLDFSIDQDNGTIETGSSTTYTVMVSNVGTKPDHEVKLAVKLPTGSELLAVDAPVEYQVQGDVLQFAAVPELRSKDQQRFRLQVKHTQAGMQIVRAQLISGNWPVAVVKEAGTRVYNDRN